MSVRVSSLAGLVLGLVCAAQLSAAVKPDEAVAILLNSKNSVSVRRFAEAKATVEREAAAGRAVAQFTLGVTTDDKAQAEKHLDASRAEIRRLAETRNDALAWYLLSVEKNSMAFLRKAADGGNVQALNALGTILTQRALSETRKLKPEVQELALTSAYRFFSKAAARRDPNGYINLGTCYLRGYGCKQDMTMAVFCFEAAAEAGHPEGMDNLSGCYQFGHGVEKNNDLCLYWAMRGRAARGDEAAAKWLKERK